MTTRICFGIVAVAFVLELIVVWFTKDPPDPSILNRSRHWGGHAYFSYMVLIPGTKLHAPEDPARSPIILYEDGRPLTHWRTGVEAIANEGLGRYMVGGQNGNAYVIFSTSDNSNPATNGRTYTLYDPEAADNANALIYRGVKSAAR